MSDQNIVTDEIKVDEPIKDGPKMSGPDFAFRHDPGPFKVGQKVRKLGGSNPGTYVVVEVC